jgi:uncharacterized delta-60 repeat protein
MKHHWMALLLVSLSLPAFCAESAPDDLDASFGTRGQHFLKLFGDEYSSQPDVELLLLPNGDIAIGDGFSWRLTSANAERTRTLDLSRACGEIPPAQCPATFGTLARQPDGRMVIAFSVGPGSSAGPPRIGILRLHADGAPDLLFGTAGTAVLSTPSLPFFGRLSPIGISHQSDGGLLVAGNADGRALVLTRFLAAGETDRAFGNGGSLQFDRFNPVAFVRTSNGNLVLASDEGRTTNEAALMRLLPNGQVDASFDARDALLMSPLFHPQALAEQADGKLIVAGLLWASAQRPYPAAIAVMRLDAQGRRDASLGTDGMVVLRIEDDRTFTSVAVALDSRARIVTAAEVTPINPEVYAGYRIAVARFLPDGAVDTLFAGGGVTTLQTPNPLARPAVVITPADAILIGGVASPTLGGGPATGPTLLRLHGGEGSVSRPIREERAIEFHHAGFGHYVIAATQREIATLDEPLYDPSKAWRRTGRSFRVWSGDAPHLSAVCRFFSGQSFAPKSSHFYTPYAHECASLRAGSTWMFEGEPFRFQLPTATPAGLGCPAASVPLYRVYNNGLGGAPNHRYTDDPAILASMLGQGWIFEGDSRTKVFACIPPP